MEKSYKAKFNTGSTVHAVSTVKRVNSDNSIDFLPYGLCGVSSPSYQTERFYPVKITSEITCKKCKKILNKKDII